MEIAKAVQSYLQIDRDRNDYSSEKKSQKRRFYLSDMTKCLRVRWLKRKGITSEFDPYVHWLFKIGDLYHDFVYKALEAQGRLLASEDYIETEHFIGRYDGIVKDEEGEAVLDVKSAPGYKIQRIMKGEDDEGAIAQVLAYQMLLMEQGRKKLKKAIILYVNKEPGDKTPLTFIERHYRLTSWRRRNLKSEMKELVEYWLANKIPPCTCPLWMKPYNAFQPLCEMKETKIKKILKDLEKGKKFITTKKVLYSLEGKKRKGVAKTK
jgi:CRISPR/Cas system-associated exonuclease Cas4 (RecB family)